MPLEVDLSDLLVSAAVVTAVGEDLAAAHLAADGRIDAASVGWRGQSAAALSATLDRWGADTAALLVRLRDHASALHSSAAAFADHEQRSASALGALH